MSALQGNIPDSWKRVTTGCFWYHAPDYSILGDHNAVQWHMWRLFFERALSPRRDFLVLPSSYRTDFKWSRVSVTVTWVTCWCFLIRGSHTVLQSAHGNKTETLTTATNQSTGKKTSTQQKSKQRKTHRKAACGSRNVVHSIVVCTFLVWLAPRLFPLVSDTQLPI